MLLATGFGTVRAQEEVVLEHDSLSKAINNEVSLLVDSTRIPTKPLKDMSTWLPDTIRALWLALVISGGGMIYNLK